MNVQAICQAAGGLFRAGFTGEMSTIEICRAVGRAMTYFSVLPTRRLVIDNA